MLPLPSATSLRRTSGQSAAGKEAASFLDDSPALSREALSFLGWSPTGFLFAKGQFERCAAAPGATDTMDAESGCIHAAVSVTECNDYEDRSGAEVQVVAEEQRARLRRIRPRWFSADIRLRGASGLSGPTREHTSPALSS